MQNAKCKMQNAKMQNAKCKMPKCKMQKKNLDFQRNTITRNLHFALVLLLLQYHHDTTMRVLKVILLHT